MTLEFVCELFCFALAGFVFFFPEEPTSSQRKLDFIENNGKGVFKKTSAIYVLGALGLFVVSSVKITSCPQDSCCSKTHGAFRHPCLMLILISSCRHSVKSADDNIYAYIKVIF